MGFPALQCVFTRYSISQYLILLPTVTIEKGEMVLKRIISNFRKLYNRKDITVEDPFATGSSLEKYAFRRNLKLRRTDRRRTLEFP